MLNRGIHRAINDLGRVVMVELEAHTEVYACERRERPAYSTWHECRRSLRAKSEQQLCLELRDSCFDALHQPRELMISVHVKPGPCRSHDV